MNPSDAQLAEIRELIVRIGDCADYNLKIIMPTIKTWGDAEEVKGILKEKLRIKLA